MDLTPIFRIEKFLDAIINNSTPPEPIYRVEFYLAQLAGADVEIPEPIFRIEKYLAKLCGEDVEIPEPVFRTEFWLAKKCGMDVETPTPVFRIEFWLDEWTGGTTPTYETLTGKILSFIAKRADAIKSLSLAIEPVQDLHGYEAPWPPGGGENKLPTTLAWMKSNNTTGTWTNNAYALNGVTFTVQEDDSGNIVGISVSGTASADIIFYVGKYVADGSSVIANGCPSGGSTSTYRVFTDNIGSDTGSGTSERTPTSGAACNSSIRLYSGYTASNLVFKPMIRLASVSDPTFAPYSNISPISGWTGAEINRTGKNLLAKPFSFRPSASTLADCFPVKAGTYTFSFDSIGTATSWRFGLAMFDANGNELSDIKYKANQNFTSYIPSLKIWWWGADTQYKSIPLTIVEDCYIRIWFGSGNTSSDMVATAAQLELGSTASDYEPYSGTSVSLTFGSTVYGGTASDNGDGSWTVVADRASVDLGTLTWSYFNSGIFYSQITGKASGGQNIICSEYPTSQVQSWSSIEDKAVVGNVANNYIYVRDTSYSSYTPSDFKTAMSGVQLVYELSEPITFTVTAETLTALVGNNNVWASTNGDITATVQTN